jgi:hypothetical protein
VKQQYFLFNLLFTGEISGSHGSEYGRDVFWGVASFSLVALMMEAESTSETA